MSRKLLLFLCLFFLLFNFPSAQPVSRNFAIFSKEKIPAYSIKKIYEDKQRYIWLGTKNGLYRYDGYEFVPFYSLYDDTTALTSNSITDLQEDADGNLWIATASDGVVKMNPYTGKMKQYPVLTPSAYPIYPVSDIFLDSDSVLWFGTGGRGIARYIPEKDSFVNFLVDPDRISDGTVRDQNTIMKLAADPVDKNIMWAAGMEGLYQFNKSTSKISKYEFIRKGKKAWKDNSFHCIYVEDLRHIWLGTWGGGLVKFDFEDKIFEHFLLDKKGYQKSVMNLNIIMDILPHGDNELYLCSFDGGFVSFNKKSKSFRPLIDEEQISGSSRSALSATVTSDGSLWVCGEDYLAVDHAVYNRFSGGFRLKPARGALNNYSQFFDAVFDSGNKKYIVAATNQRGLLEINKHLNISGIVPIFKKNFVTSFSSVFFDRAGRLYALAQTPPYIFYKDSGVKYLRPAAGNLFSKNQLPSNIHLRLMKYAGDNGIWMAGDNNRVLLWNLNERILHKFRLSVSPESRLPDKVYINDLSVDHSSNAWIATNTGIFKVDRNGGNISHYYAHGRASSDIASDFINAITVDRENKIWIAPQYQGLQVFDPALKKVVSSFSAARGDLANHVDDLIFDDQDNLWATSNAGLLYWDRSTGIWKVFNARDGLRKNFLTGYICHLSDKKILLGIESDVIVFDPATLPENRQMPAMHITGFDVMGRNYLKDTLPDFKKVIELPYDQNRIDITYTAIETLFPDKVKFHYRLIGLDDDWTPTDSRRISFASLRPGFYRFEVKAINGDGYECVTPATISFTIEKAFWQKTWFLVLCVLAIAGIVYGIYMYRIRQFLKIQRVRNNISADLHDDIGSRLTNIQLMTLITKKQARLDENTIQQLDKISAEVNASSEALHEIVSNIRNPDPDAEDIGTSLRRYAVQVFELSNIGLNIQIDEELSELKLPLAKRRNVYLVYREVLNNITKHADAALVRIKVFKNGNCIQLLINDDGKGFDMRNLKPGNGLRNIQERVKRNKGTFTINSSDKDGTSVNIVLPL